jgi:hypothetical protein
VTHSHDERVTHSHDERVTHSHDERVWQERVGRDEVLPSEPSIMQA